MSMNTLAERLKFAMSRKNLTQADLARVSGAARSSVTNWLNGRTQNLKGKNLVKISGVLGVSTDWLAYGTGEIDSSWPFDGFTLFELNSLPPDVLEDISDYVLMKIIKNKRSKNNQAA